MDRIIKAGQYFYDVTYSLVNNTPEIADIHAVAELIIFNHAVPILFESSDRIPLTEAKRLTIDMEGKLPLYEYLLREIPKIPKSNPILQAVS